MARAALAVLGLAAGGLAVLALAVIATRAPRTTLTAFLISFVFMNYQLAGRAATDYPLTASIGSVQVSALDAITIAFGIATVFQFRRVPVPRISTIPAGVLTLIVLMCVLSGILDDGIESGVNNWRYWILSVAVYWWSLVSLPRLGARAVGPFIVAGVVASAAQAYGFMTRGFGGAIDPVFVNGHATDPRPVHATAALLMTAALVAVLAGMRPGAFAGRALLGTWLLVSIVASQQRTVWLATIAALVALGALSYRSSRHQALIAVGGAYLAVTGAIGFLAAASLSSTIANSASSGETFWYRLELWSDRLAIDRSPHEWIFGGIIGFGEAIKNDPRVMSAHNMFVETVTTIGVVGVIVVALLLVAAIARTPTNNRTTVVPILVAILVIGVTYQWPSWAWCLIAFGCAGGLPKVTPPQPAVAPVSVATIADQRMTSGATSR